MASSFGSGWNEYDPCLRSVAVKNDQRAAGWIGETESGISGQSMQSGDSALAGK